MSEEQTVVVYKEGSLLHFPHGLDPSRTTCCGLDVGEMEREERPIMWAGVWCTECFKAGTRPLGQEWSKGEK